MYPLSSLWIYIYSEAWEVELWGEKKDNNQETRNETLPILFELMYMLEEYRIIITSIYSCLIDREQEGENVDDWHLNSIR